MKELTIEEKIIKALNLLDDNSDSEFRHVMEIMGEFDGNISCNNVPLLWYSNKKELTEYLDSVIEKYGEQKERIFPKLKIVLSPPVPVIVTCEIQFNEEELSALNKMKEDQKMTDKQNILNKALDNLKISIDDFIEVKEGHFNAKKKIMTNKGQLVCINSNEDPVECILLNEEGKTDYLRISAVKEYGRNPKFKVGDKIVSGNAVGFILSVGDTTYSYKTVTSTGISNVFQYEFEQTESVYTKI